MKELSNKYHPWALLATPILVIAAFFVLEDIIRGTPAIEMSLEGSINDTSKKVIELNSDLAHLFISLSTAILGGIAYYVKSFPGKLASGPRWLRAAMGGAIASVVLSIFFGHLWIAGMRNELANNTFDPRSHELYWPEVLQYIFFLLTLIWFAFAVYFHDMDSVNKLSEAKEVQKDSKETS